MADFFVLNDVDMLVFFVCIFFFFFFVLLIKRGRNDLEEYKQDS